MRSWAYPPPQVYEILGIPPAPPPQVYEILGIPPPLRPRVSYESGQILVDKARHWPGLMLTLFLNYNHYIYYDLLTGYMGHGDKGDVSVCVGGGAHGARVSVCGGGGGAWGTSECVCGGGGHGDE